MSSRLNDSVRRFLLDVAHRFSGGSDYAVRLIAESLRYLSMALLHFFVRQIELGLTCFVRRNLSCIRSSLFLFLKVLLDLPATRARCRKVFFAVAYDFWLPTLPSFDLVAECLSRAASSERYTARAYCCVL